MKMLPKDQIQLHMSLDEQFVIASLFEDQGYRYWKKYLLSELPNDLISREDLERFKIKTKSA